MIGWLIDTFWAASLLIIGVLLLRKAFVQYFGATITYALWLIPAARLFMPAIEKEIATLSKPIDIILFHTNTANNIVENAATALTSHSSHINWVLITAILWVSIATAIFIIQIARYMMMRNEILANAHHYGQIGNVIVIESDIVSGPLAFGIFKKYVAVPQDFEKLFPIGERDMAIAHEMSHHKSGDLIANLFAFIFLCLTWFSPLSWYAWTKFRLDQESACDARVLKNTNNKAKQIYGRVLTRGAANDSPIFLAAMSNPKTIITRLRRLKMPPISKSRSFFGRIFIVTIITISLPFTATTYIATAQDNMVNDSDKKDTRNIDSGSMDIDAEAIILKISKDDKLQPYNRNGQTYYISGGSEISKEDVDKLLADAEKSFENFDFKPNNGVKGELTVLLDENNTVKTYKISDNGQLTSDTDKKKIFFNSEDGNLTKLFKTQNFDVNIAKLSLKELEALKTNMNDNLIPSIKIALEDIKLSETEQKKILGEFEAELEQLDKAINKLQSEK